MLGSYLYRGVRTWGKDGPSEILLALLNLIGPLLLEARLPPSTRYIEAAPELIHVSSTLVRARAAGGESLSDLVPPAIAKKVAALWGAAA